MATISHFDSVQRVQWRAHADTGADLLAEGAAFQAAFRRLSPNYERVLYPLPMFDRAFLADLVDSGRAVLDMILAIPQRVFDGDYAAWMRFQGCPADEIAFLQPMCSARSVKTATRFARPDCLLTHDGFRIVEMNIAPPIGGTADCDRMVSEFRATPFAQRLEREGLHVGTRQTLATWAAAVRAVARASARSEQPVFFEALADPAEVAQANPQHVDFVQAIRDAGFTHCRGNIADLRVGDDGVHFGDRRVNLVFTAFTYAELRAFRVPRELVLALVQADAAERVDFIAPPVNILFDNKCNLELLTGPGYRHHWTDDEHRLIARVLPATRRLKADALVEALERQADRVLKPTRDFGGNGVLVGSQCTPELWAQALQRALDGGEPHVLQETVRSLELHEVERAGATERYATCAGPLFFGDETAAVFLRMTPAAAGDVPVINAAQGACMGVAMTRCTP